ncbi:MAG: hypothetical protein IJM69_08140 [Firmicutes bacterium]|nr:hypothetical protein [Bacillota bacterium]
MKKKMMMVLAFMLAGTMVVSGCGTTTDNNEPAAEVEEQVEEITADEEAVETEANEQAEEGQPTEADAADGQAEEEQTVEESTDAEEAADEQAAETQTEEGQPEEADEAAEEATTEEATAEEATTEEQAITATYLTAEDITVNETYHDNVDGGHAIAAEGEDAAYSNIAVTKSGDSSGDEADFYGENAAIYASDGATLDLAGILVETDGTHANGVFSYGSGTTVNISDSVIYTEGNCSGGLMTTGGGTMNAENLTIHTTGNSSAAIRSDRGGGIVTVTGGSYQADGKGSPAIYSTADITVNDALLTSTSAQGVVIEGRNSVTLNNVTLVADNNSKNSDKSPWYQAVMIYQSMSGDAAEGLSYFTMTGGSLTNANGDIFFVNNTSTEIALTGVAITNNGDGVFLRAAAAGWGRDGQNGGHVTLTATDQSITGDLLVDEISSLDLTLYGTSDFTGAVNPDGEEGEVNLVLTDEAVWTLTADSYVTSLEAADGAIDLNGYTLYVSGEAYAG